MNPDVDIRMSVRLLPTKCLQAIVIADSKYGQLGNNWQNCIFGRATQVVSGALPSQCGTSLAINTFRFTGAESQAMSDIIHIWDSRQIDQATLLRVINTELMYRQDRVAYDDVVNSVAVPVDRVLRSFTVSGASYLNRILNEVSAEFKKPAGDVVSVKRPEKFDFSDAEIYAWLETFSDDPEKELVDA